MDLRIIKTRYQIKDAFLKLRNKLMPEKIKVKDICEAAMINKTTFYKHYADSMELSNEIDDAAIDKVVSSFPSREKLFEDSKAFMTELFTSLNNEAEDLKVVFRGKQEVLVQKLDARLRSIYCNKSDDLEKEIKTTFAISGFVGVANDYLFAKSKEDMQTIVQEATKLLESLIPAKA